MSGEGRRRRVLMLRSVPDEAAADRYTVALESGGFDVSDVPTLAFQYQELECLRACLDAPAQYAGLVFTSPRAVFAAGEATAGGQLPAEWGRKPCYVVGERTDALVKKVLGLTGSGSDSGNAANLAQLIISEIEKGQKPLLFPAGNLKRETLPTKLEEAGIPLHIITVYVTCPHPRMQEMLKETLENPPDFIVYFSPSAVNFSKDVVIEAGHADDIRHVSIGPSTREALELAGMTVFGSAAKPCPEAVLQTLLQR